MYPEYMMESIKMVEKTRNKRLELAKKYGKKVFPGMTEEERKDVLDKYHPDYQSDALKELRIGPNKGDKMVNEVVDVMESYPRDYPEKFDLSNPDLETDPP